MVVHTRNRFSLGGGGGGDKTGEGITCMSQRKDSGNQVMLA